MPSAEHESPIALAKLDPGMVVWLLANVFDIKVPDYHHARAQPTDVRVMVPRTYHADGMVLYCDAADQPVFAVVVEVQRGRDKAKRHTWKLYVAQLEAELGVSAALVVFCPDPVKARWYRQLIEPDGLSSLPLQPWIFTTDDVPLVMDVDLARANPAIAVLSAVCHGAQPEVDAMFPALVEVLRTVGPHRAILYYDIMLAGLPQAARARWEEFMTATLGHEYYSDVFRNLAAQHEEIGEVRGEARGEARSVLAVLNTRGIDVPDAVRDQILACTDTALLDTWLRRAVTAPTAEDVIRE